MRVESIGFERFPDRTPDNLAYRYIVGYKPVDSAQWWSDFVMKEIAFDRESAALHAKHLREKLKRGTKLLPELDSTRMWQVCVVDIKQPEKEFSED